MIDHYVVGGFYRVHGGRSNQENLNAPGSRFQMLAFDECCSHPDPSCGPDDKPNRFYAYGVPDPLLTRSPLYETLGANDHERQLAYRAMARMWLLQQKGVP